MEPPVSVSASPLVIDVNPNRLLYSAGLTQSVTVINYTTKPIEQALRIGIDHIVHYPIRGAENPGRNDVVIAVELTGFGDVGRELELAISRCAVEERELGQRILDSMIASKRNKSPCSGTVTFYTELSISEAQLLAHENGMYVKELDVYVGLKGRVGPHPYSELGRALNVHFPFEVTDVPSGAVVYTLVDNDNQMGTLYTRMCGSVRDIVSVKDRSRPNGLYIQYWHHTEGNKPETEFIELSDLEKLRERDVYPTKQLALAEGDVESKYRLRTLEGDIALAGLKQQQGLAKIESDSLSAVFDQRNRELDTKLLELKHGYERESLARKNTNDVIKIIPSIIGIVTLGLSLFLGFTR